MDISDSSDSDYDDNEPILQRKKKTNRPRINFNLDDFIARFRLSRGMVERIVQDIGPRLQHETDMNDALSPKEQIQLALRYFAGGGFMVTIGDAHGVDKSTVSRSVHAVAEEITDFYFDMTIRWPENINSVVAGFYKLGRIPCCIGAIDGCHVEIRKPSIDEDQYVNRHQVHSINTMMVAGPDYRFYYVSAKRPGKLNDARVLRLSTLANRMNGGWRPTPNAIILGDSGYGLSEWLITPILRANTTQGEDRFNEARRKTRQIVECAFGILKRRFACLNKMRLPSPEFSALVIKACTILHNISIQMDPLDPDEVDEIMREIEDREDAIAGDVIEDQGNALGQVRRANLVAMFN